MYMVAAVVKPILRVLAGNPGQGLFQGTVQGLAGAGLGRAQGRSEFAPGLLDGRKIGRIGRQKQQAGSAGSAGSDELGHAGHFVHGQVVEYDHVAGRERGTKYLLEAHSETGRVQRPVQVHDRPQGVNGQGPDKCNGGAHAQRNALAHVLPAFGSAVAPGKGQVQVRFVYELEVCRVMAPTKAARRATTWGVSRSVAWRAFFAP